MNTMKKMSKSGLVKLVFCLLGLFTVAAAATGCDERAQSQYSGYEYYWVDDYGNLWLW